MSKSIFYTPQSLRQHYPTRKKLLKFKKRFAKQSGQRFGFFISVFQHVAFPPGRAEALSLVLFKRQSDH